MDVWTLSLGRNNKKCPQKKQKKADTDGFSCGNIVEGLASIKRYSADWQRVNK